MQNSFVSAVTYVFACLFCLSEDVNKWEKRLKGENHQVICKITCCALECHGSHCAGTGLLPFHFHGSPSLSGNKCLGPYLSSCSLRFLFFPSLYRKSSRRLCLLTMYQAPTKSKSTKAFCSSPKLREQENV